MVVLVEDGVEQLAEPVAAALLRGELTEAEAREQTAQATRRFARRQDSWFRKDPRIVWIRYDDPELVGKALAAVKAARGLSENG